MCTEEIFYTYLEACCLKSSHQRRCAGFHNLETFWKRKKKKKEVVVLQSGFDWSQRSEKGLETMQMKGFFAYNAGEHY